RGESLRRRGRIEDAAALYQAILELDPANEAATIFLANLFTDEMLPVAIDVEERFAWWREADALLRAALARHPQSAALHHRRALLISGLPLAQPDLEGRLDAELGNWRLIALRHLVTAVLAEETLADLGRSHLVRTAVLAPDVAARALRAGDSETLDEIRELVSAVQRTRAAMLAHVLLDPERDESIGDALVLGMAAVEATAAAGRDPAAREAARAAIGRFEAVLPDRWLPILLGEVLDAPR
ncbi:MAG: tetratricopeptide repeat protein, partial [Planctomycetota bacterium]|nr:tetratricopeptide repeat protein [Planctomycetota bacterium]